MGSPKTSSVPFDAARRFTELQKPFTSRMREALNVFLRRATSRLPGIKRWTKSLEPMPLLSDHASKRAWREQPIGTPGKPQSIDDIPWAYLRENAADIPFTGLREYWYPALPSEEVPAGRAIPVQICGDALVLFRDAEGTACALEDRCAHRGPLLSLGQVGVWRPGTLTCAYHGATFDARGECVAFLGEGPESKMCGKLRTPSYPCEEVGGIVWVYCGQEARGGVLDTVPHAREVFSGDYEIWTHRLETPVSHLHTLDNALDMSHPGILHRTCALFGDQKLGGELETTALGNTGLHVRYVDKNPHPGPMAIDEIEWHLPNFAYHNPGDLPAPRPELAAFGYHWFVPRDVASTCDFFIIARKKSPPLRHWVFKRMWNAMWARKSQWPGSAVSCVAHADHVMMMSQGRVPIWPEEKLGRTDAAIIKARKMLMAAHRSERAAVAPTGRAARPRTGQRRGVWADPAGQEKK